MWRIYKDVSPLKKTTMYIANINTVISSKDYMPVATARSSRDSETC